uniref:Putative ovule protein n=1 Tax=Solanum chacoense TaxID=4108 RepID=A0A0V0H1I3_SOLCH
MLWNGSELNQMFSDNTQIKLAKLCNSLINQTPPTQPNPPRPISTHPLEKESLLNGQGARGLPIIH